MKKSEAKKRKKKVMLIATLSTAAIIVGGLTFAWYTSKDEVTNTFKASGNLKTVVVENFTPPTNWQPGITTDKVVQVTNTGTLDAYTRVQLTPKLSFDYKGTAVSYANTVTLTSATNDTLHTTDDGCETHTVGEVKTSGAGYVTLTSEAVDAIDNAVVNWNADAANTDKYVQWVVTSTTAASNITGITTVNSTATDMAEQYKPLVAMLKGTYLKDVVLYVKASEGKSKETDDKVYETGYNYEFLGYIKTSDGTYYEIEITPDKSDGVTYTQTKSTTDDGNTQIVSTETSTLTVNVFTSNHVEYDNMTDIEKILTINFNTGIKKYDEIGSATENDYWISRVGDDGNYLYYYNRVLKSGESTPPLVKSVTFRSDYEGFVDSDGNTHEISNLVYDLVVTDLSAQASIEAAVDTFGGDGANDCKTDAGTGETSLLSDTDGGNDVYKAIIATSTQKEKSGEDS
jgi:alternate signal-mediated exported protein